MRYKVPKVETTFELKENIDSIEKTIDLLNEKRDQGLSSELLDNLKKQLLIKQVYHSNAIEGNRLSLRETELILNGMVVNERPLKDEIEARSLSSATDYLYSLINGREPLSKRAILELHGLLMKGIPGIEGGQFRKNEVQIKNSDHVPPHFNDVDSHMDELFQWMNRNSHKYPPLVMASILHHWMTWIHPFVDGNGRVARMFLNFFLLQKGYPEVIVKITDRDNYYNSLISADNGNINELIELFADNIRETISSYEELINEDERQKSWLSKYKVLNQEQYVEAKAKHSYDYEVWKNQMFVFKTLLKKSLREISDILKDIDISIKDYEIISFSQYLDLLEDRKVSNTWYMSIKVFNQAKNESLTLVFYFERLYRSKILDFVDSRAISIKNKYKKFIPPAIKLYISARRSGVEVDLKKKVDLVNIGTYKDQLSFGIIDRGAKREHWKKPKIKSLTNPPGPEIRKFLDQLFELFLDMNAPL